MCVCLLYIYIYIYNSSNLALAQIAFCLLRLSICLDSPFCRQTTLAMPKPRGRGIGRDRGSGTENNRPRSRHRVASEIQFVIPPVAQSTQDVDADTDGGETAVAAEVEEVEQTQCSEKEGGSDLDRRLNALVKFLEVKEYSDRLAEDEDTEIEWEALSSSHDETATPSHDETASEHDTDASDVEDEDTRVLEQVPAVAAKQETAVAARIETSVR